MQKKFVASAPGKIIITGEHFVVHGSLAVAAAINRRATVTLSVSEKPQSVIISGGKTVPAFRRDGLFRVVKSVLAEARDQYDMPETNFSIRVASDIPQGSGLGSSAAVSVATSAAISAFMGNTLSRDEIWKLATLGEKSVHGNPSGIDTRASLSGGLFTFARASAPKTIHIDLPIYFLVVFSGKTRRTSELVSKVNAMKVRYPDSFFRLSALATFLSRESAHALERHDLPRLGTLMELTQLSLSRIGVSTLELDKVLEKLRTPDCLGAKITGAGGGGSVIALPKTSKARRMLEIILPSHPQSFLTSIPQEGLRQEE